MDSNFEKCYIININKKPELYKGMTKEELLKYINQNIIGSTAIKACAAQCWIKKYEVKD